VTLKTADADGYGDIQDLRLHVLDILEQLRLQRQENENCQKKRSLSLQIK
jgi:hypothetical protein